MKYTALSLEARGLERFQLLGSLGSCKKLWRWCSIRLVPFNMYPSLEDNETRKSIPSLSLPSFFSFLASISPASQFTSTIASFPTSPCCLKSSSSFHFSIHLPFLFLSPVITSLLPSYFLHVFTKFWFAVLSSL